MHAPLGHHPQSDGALALADNASIDELLQLLHDHGVLCVSLCRLRVFLEVLEHLAQHRHTLRRLPLPDALSSLQGLSQRRATISSCSTWNTYTTQAASRGHVSRVPQRPLNHLPANVQGVQGLAELAKPKAHEDQVTIKDCAILIFQSNLDTQQQGDVPNLFFKGSSRAPVSLIIDYLPVKPQIQMIRCPSGTDAGYGGKGASPGA